MTADEELVQLKKELAAERAKTARLEEELARERAEKAQLRQMLEEMLRRLGEVEGQLAKDSHNSASGPACAREARRSQEGKRGILVTR